MCIFPQVKSLGIVWIFSDFSMIWLSCPLGSILKVLKCFLASPNQNHSIRQLKPSLVVYHVTKLGDNGKAPMKTPQSLLYLPSSAVFTKLTLFNQSCFQSSCFCNFSSFIFAAGGKGCAEVLSLYCRNANFLELWNPALKIFNLLTSFFFLFFVFTEI